MQRSFVLAVTQEVSQKDSRCGTFFCWREKRLRKPFFSSSSLFAAIIHFTSSLSTCVSFPVESLTTAWSNTPGKRGEKFSSSGVRFSSQWSGRSSSIVSWTLFGSQTIRWVTHKEVAVEKKNKNQCWTVEEVKREGNKITRNVTRKKKLQNQTFVCICTRLLLVSDILFHPLECERRDVDCDVLLQAFHFCRLFPSFSEHLSSRRGKHCIAATSNNNNKKQKRNSNSRKNGFKRLTGWLHRSKRGSNKKKRWSLGEVYMCMFLLTECWVVGAERKKGRRMIKKDVTDLWAPACFSCVESLFCCWWIHVCLTPCVLCVLCLTPESSSLSPSSPFCSRLVMCYVSGAHKYQGT